MSYADLVRRLVQVERRISRLEAREIEAFRIRCRVYNSGAFTHNSTGNFLPFTFDSERWDTDSMHSTSVNTDRLTCNTAGFYIVSFSCRWTANATGTRALRIRVNSTTSIAQLRHNNLGASDAVQMTISTMYYMPAADWFTVDGFQDTGGNLNVFADANYSYEFSTVRIG